MRLLKQIGIEVRDAFARRLTQIPERGQPCCSVETFLGRGFQPERLTDISQPRSGWNFRGKRAQVPKGRGETHVDCFRRPFRTVYPLAPIQALRAWLMSGVAFATRQAAVPIFSTRQQPSPRGRVHFCAVGSQIVRADMAVRAPELEFHVEIRTSSGCTVS